MLTSAKSSEKTLVWILRAIGFITNYFGFRFIFKPLESGASLLPFLAGIIEFGAAAISLPSAVSISGITIAAGWLDARTSLKLFKYVIYAAWLVLCYLSLSTIFRFARNQVEAGVKLSGNLLRIAYNLLQRFFKK